MTEEKPLSLRARMHQRLGFVDETAEVEDPWGLGVTLEVRCDDGEAYLRELTRESKAQSAAAFNAAKTKALEVFRNRGDKKNGKEELSPEEIEAELQSALDSLQDDRLHPDDAAAMIEGRRFGHPRSVAKLVARFSWPEQGGEFDEAQVVDLLSDTTTLPGMDDHGDAIPYGGQGFGVAWQRFIEETAAARTKARNAAVRVLEKNSPRSSSTSTSGARSTTRSKEQPGKEPSVS